MDPVAAVVLGACALFVGSTLLAMFGRPHRNLLVAAWVAMVGFAFLASFIFWKRVQLGRSADVIYVDLAGSPGSRRVTLAKPGLSPGYRVRLVRRSDRTFDKELFAKLGSCNWRIPVCEKLVLTEHTFDPEGILEFLSEYPDVVLQYEASPETQKFLDAAAIELRCPSGFHKALAQWLQMLNSRLTFFLGGLVLAGLGASVQRRKLRIQARAGNPPVAPS
jgi:hypothetical protein